MYVINSIIGHYIQMCTHMKFEILSTVGDYKSFMSVTNPARGEKEFRRKDFVKKFSSKSTKRVSKF